MVDSEPSLLLGRDDTVDLGADDETVVLVSLEKLDEFIPFEIAPWSEAVGLRASDVQAALDEGRLNPLPYSASPEDWTLQMHAERIAWLVLNPSDDPIEIEFPYPNEPWMELRDGWHRLAAAQFAARTFIAVSVSGFIDHAFEVFEVPDLEAQDSVSCLSAF